MIKEKPDRNPSSKEEKWPMSFFIKKVDDKGVQHFNLSGVILFKTKQDRAEAAGAIRKGESMFDDYYLDSMDNLDKTDISHITAEDFRSVIK
jgi:hypothetical protein